MNKPKPLPEIVLKFIDESCFLENDVEAIKRLLKYYINTTDKKSKELPKILQNLLLFDSQTKSNDSFD